jgi:FeS assembly protein IscX
VDNHSPNSSGGGPLTWDDTWTIASLLHQLHPDVSLDSLSLLTIYRWTLALPGFEDDPALANDEILLAILCEWIEEA